MSFWRKAGLTNIFHFYLGKKFLISSVWYERLHEPLSFMVLGPHFGLILLHVSQGCVGDTHAVLYTDTQPAEQNTHPI